MCPETLQLEEDQKGYTKKLCCSEEVFNSITVECVREFKKHHPELDGINITQNMILGQLRTFYLNSR